MLVDKLHFKSPDQYFVGLKATIIFNGIILMLLFKQKCSAANVY